MRNDLNWVAASYVSSHLSFKSAVALSAHAPVIHSMHRADSSKITRVHVGRGNASMYITYERLCLVPIRRTHINILSILTSMLLRPHHLVDNDVTVV